VNLFTLDIRRVPDPHRINLFISISCGYPEYAVFVEYIVVTTMWLCETSVFRFQSYQKVPFRRFHTGTAREGRELKSYIRRFLLMNSAPLCNATFASRSPLVGKYVYIHTYEQILKSASKSAHKYVYIYTVYIMHVHITRNHICTFNHTYIDEF
jgi:hypothetical protein